MTKQEKQEKIAAHKAKRTKEVVLQEAKKDLDNGKMSQETFNIFKKKNS
jgi:hypothetical protein